MTKPTIGFIGVGLMGHGMAKNIVEAGYPLVTMAHKKREAVDDLIGRGATEAKSPKEIAEQSEIIRPRLRRLSGAKTASSPGCSRAR